MTADSPWALPVPVDQEFPPVNLAPPADGSGVVVALVADEGPRSQGWGARVAVSLAREWAGDGLKVFLADGDLDRPALHRVLERDNGEGMADAVVFGASPGRIGRPVREGGFLFASAGTVVADPEGTWAHPRWGTLLEAFRDSGSLLLLYLPADRGSGVDELVARADRVIHLTTEAPPQDPGTGHLYVHPAAGTLEAAPALAGPAPPEEPGFDVPPPGPAVLGEEEDQPFSADFSPEGDPAPEVEAEAGAGISFEHELGAGLDAGEVAGDEAAGELDFGAPPEDEESVDLDFGEVREEESAGLEVPEAEHVVGDFTLQDEGTEEAPGDEAESPDDPVVIGDFAFPEEGDGEATAEEEVLEGELVVGDDFPSGGDALAPDEEVWTGTGELQITDEWAGDGPAAEGGAPRPGDVEEPAEASEEEPAQPAPGPAASGFQGTSPEPGVLQGLEGSVPPTGPAAPVVAGGARPEAETRRSPTPRPEPARRPPVRARPVERNLRPRLLLLLLIVVAAVGIAAWLGYVTIPGVPLDPPPGGVGMGGVDLPFPSPGG